MLHVIILIYLRYTNDFKVYEKYYLFKNLLTKKTALLQ